MRYVFYGVLGGFLGVVLTWTLIPNNTSIDDAWGYIWIGLGVGLFSGIGVALRRKRGGRAIPPKAAPDASTE